MRYAIVVQKMNLLPYIVTAPDIENAMLTTGDLLRAANTPNPQIHFLIDFEDRSIRRFYFDPQGELTLASPEESGNQLGYATDWQYFEPDAVAPMSVQPSREDFIVEAADTVIAAAEVVKEAAATGTLPPKRTKADRVRERKERIEKKKR